MTFPCIIQQYHNHKSLLYKAYVLGDELMVFKRSSLPDLAGEHLNSLAFDSRLDYPELKDFSSKRQDEESSIRRSSCGVGEGDGGGEVEGGGEEQRQQQQMTCLRDGVSNNDGAIVDNGFNGIVGNYSKLVITKEEESTESLGSTSSKSSSQSRRINVTELPDDICKLEDNFSCAAEAISDSFGLSLFGFDVIIPQSTATTVAALSPYSSGGGVPEILIIDINFFPSYKEVSDFPSKLRRFFRKKAGLVGV